jgi:hypothetical protein
VDWILDGRWMSNPMRSPGTPPAPSIPELGEIIRRFNAACAYLDDAIRASQNRCTDHYESGLLKSAREMGSALDLSALRCLGLAQPERIEELLKLNFPALVEQLRGLTVPSVDAARGEGLKRWRNLRNRAEHAPIHVPSLPALLDALRGTRRFIVEAFGVHGELADPEQPSVNHHAPGEQRAPTVLVARDDSHRSTDPKSWIASQIDEGLRRLNAGRADGAPLNEAAVQRVLSGMARDLAASGAAPSDPFRVNASTNPPETNRRLYVEAGWLVEETGNLRFHDPRLPALLVGLDLASLGKAIAPLRSALGRQKSWAEAAWAATAAGDFPDAWLSSLFEDGEMDRLPDQVVTACAALAGLQTPRDRATLTLVQRAAATAAEALVWLIPRLEPRDGGAGEPWDAFRLSRAGWQRAVLDLARGTRDLAEQPARGDERLTGALDRLVITLGLQARVSEETARAVQLLCRPWPRGGFTPLDQAFFRELFSVAGIASHVDEQFSETWMIEVGLPALWKGDEGHAARLLTVAEDRNPAGFLLNRPELLSYWCEAWERFAQMAPIEEAARTWLVGAMRVAMTGAFDEGVETFLLNDAPEQLHALGAWDLARSLLEDALAPRLGRTKPDENQLRYGAGLFALAGLSPEEWSRRIATWAEECRLPWQTLIAAGAPHDAVARWCIDKLLQKRREAPNLDGPIGIIVSGGGEISRADGWQLAFNQAGEALPWLLEHGDEDAVTILADACFATDEACRHNPIVAKFVGLSVPLSQQFWGHVIGRPEGRAALYARVQLGRGLGSNEHFLPGKPVYLMSCGLWDAVSELLINARFVEQRPLSEGEKAEAGRLLAAFEKWMAELPKGFWRSHPERVPWADPAMRVTKARMVLCAAVNAQDVTEQLQTLLRSIVDDADPREAQVLVLLGIALGCVCERPGEPSEALLALAVTPRVASLFTQDMAGDFWAALLRRFGVEAVTALVDTLASPDLGLGFFDALARHAPEALDRCQVRPDLLRAVLVRSATSGFVPSSAFHEVAWHRPRQPEEIRDLDGIPAGAWLRGLIEQSRRWPDDKREAFLRWLAQRSRDSAVRQRCLQALRIDEESRAQRKNAKA